MANPGPADNAQRMPHCASGYGAPPLAVMPSRMRVIQDDEASRLNRRRRGLLDHPRSPMMTPPVEPVAAAHFALSAAAFLHSERNFLRSLP